MISEIMAILNMAAILKKMAAILNMKISNSDFSTPKTLEMCYYMAIYDERGAFCAIFYFMVILAAILAAILDFFKMLKGASLAPTGFVKSRVWEYQNGNKPLWDLQCKVTCHFLQTIPFRN